MILAVTLLDALAVNVSTVEPFFWIVNVASLTVGIVGLLLRSLYDPDVATVAKVGLFRICATPLLAFQSEFT